ncbi:hypothetical protein EYF80_020125 [Liparis tanakae]|uniref:Uncharacterized protein n=1 Tax=Liparis tanakae TaxID=230148 RepID=A0A4Z2HWD4_9TELE|nr:hypothetical protein EYF80_020125 [Liparis tanakae]
MNTCAPRGLMSSTARRRVSRYRLSSSVRMVLKRWTGSQGVALSFWAGVELAGRAGRAVPVPLDEEVGDVHRIRQRLQGTCSCAASGCDQSEDPLVHELTCWTEEKYIEGGWMNGEEERKGGGVKKGMLSTLSLSLINSPQPLFFLPGLMRWHEDTQAKSTAWRHGGRRERTENRVEI